MGLLGGFFVPLYDFHLTPKDAEHMVICLHNPIVYRSTESQENCLILIVLSGSQRCLLIRANAGCWPTKAQGSSRRYRQYGPEINAPRLV